MTRTRSRSWPASSAFCRSSSSLGHSRPWMTPPRVLMAQAAMMPSGVPPMPTSRSMPVPSRAAMMAPATSPSVMNLIRAPVDRISSTSVGVPGPVEDDDGDVRRATPAWPSRPGGRSRRPAAGCRRRRRRPGRSRASPCRTRPTGRTSTRAATPRAPTGRCPCPSAVSRVPSIGSTATSHSGPVPSPTRSPLKSIGASSFSPSPMTTTPFMVTVPMRLRIASTAAPSAPFLSPATDPAAGGHRGRLGDAHQLERQVAVGCLDRRRHGTGTAARRVSRSSVRLLPRRRLL